MVGSLFKGAEVLRFERGDNRLEVWEWELGTRMGGRNTRMRRHRKLGKVGNSDDGK